MLALLKQDSKLIAKTLASTIGLTDRQVERILSKLKADGKIVRHGASKNGYWEVFHISFIPQYRKKQLYGKMKDDV